MSVTFICEKRVVAKHKDANWTSKNPIKSSNPIFLSKHIFQSFS